MKIGIESNILRHMLNDAYFLNGTAYAGKSTMARLLAERFDGVLCGENYHDALMDATDAAHQPSLNYFKTMSGWREFVTRAPDVYEQWLDGGAREAAEMEIALLLRLSAQGKKLFVDTNIAPEVLREIAQPSHVAIMLAPQSMSVDRFFDRDDPDKQFLLRVLEECPDPAAAKANFRACLAQYNSRERYEAFASAGLPVFVRDESDTIEGMFDRLARHFGLV